jgi:hypothetical protein
MSPSRSCSNKDFLAGAVAGAVAGTVGAPAHQLVGWCSKLLQAEPRAAHDKHTLHHTRPGSAAAVASARPALRGAAQALQRAQWSVMR